MMRLLNVNKKMNIIADLKKNPKQTAILIAVISLIAAIIYFNFLLKPQVVRVFGAVGRMNKIRADLKNARSDIAGMPRFKEDIDEYKDKVDSYEKMLPAEQEIPSLLENLSEMAKSSNIKIVGIMPVIASGEKDTGSSKTYQEIPILISAKSGYHELGRFLSKLENSERFMKVADLEIKSNKGMLNRHDVELLILTYILLKGK